MLTMLNKVRRSLADVIWHEPPPQPPPHPKNCITVISNLFWLVAKLDAIVIDGARALNQYDHPFFSRMILEHLQKAWDESSLMPPFTQILGASPEQMAKAMEDPKTFQELILRWLEEPET